MENERDIRASNLGFESLGEGAVRRGAGGAAGLASLKLSIALHIHAPSRPSKFTTSISPPPLDPSPAECSHVLDFMFS